jgi:hypothetical protein
VFKNGGGNRRFDLASPAERPIHLSAIRLVDAEGGSSNPFPMPQQSAANPPHSLASGEAADPPFALGVAAAFPT